MSNDESLQRQSICIVNPATNKPVQTYSNIITTSQRKNREHPTSETSQQFLYPEQSIYKQSKRLPLQSYPQHQNTFNQSTNMMAHRDMGYGYMPQAIPNYSAAQSYHSSIAAMSAYYPEPSRYSSTSSNSTYLSDLGYSRYSISSEDREQMQRRRRRNSTDRRHQVKLLSRKTSGMHPTTTAQTTSIASSRIPSIMGTGLEESPVQSSPIDMFTTQAPMQTSNYITDQYQRAASYEPSSSLRDDYRATSLHPTYNITTQAMSSSPTYSTAYTMASMNPSMQSLIPPPMIPSPSPQHVYPVSGRSSPLPPQGTISPHVETVALDNRRDKPQCWDHGCNGREFSTFSNLLRHQREKSGSASKAYCPRCGAEFTRTTARNGHMEHGKCKSRRASGAGTGSGSQAGSVSSATGSTGISATLR